MKINQNVTFQNKGVTPALVTPGKVKPATTEPSAAPVQVRQSPATPTLPSTVGDFDAARVAEIRESIGAGRYHVNTAKIADGLLSSVRDLLNKPAS